MSDTEFYENYNYSNIYGILNLSQDASKDEIKKAYKKLIIKYHPDKNNNISSDKFLEIKYAYDILSDDKKKKLYDDKLYFDNVTNSINYPTIKNIKNLYNKFIDSTDMEKVFRIIINKNILLDNILTNKFFIKNNVNLIRQIINIDIIQNFTLKEVWDGIGKNVFYKRETKDLFEELIYPIDFKQVYEYEGEIIKINGVQYNGDINIRINITELDYSGENYYIHNDEIYLLVNSKRIINDKFVVNFLDGNKYKFNLKKLTQIEKDIGNVYMKKNFGLKKHKTNNNIIDSLNYTTIHGNLFFIPII